MTPVALWTGRLPGLRRLPRRASLAVAGLVSGVGIAAAFGVFGREYLLLQLLTIFAAGWSAWRHRWPTELPIRLRSQELPQGPDERAVMVEIRKDSSLLGWDVGILWFEKGGVGFVGQTVSFVVPRSIMHTVEGKEFLQSTFRAPQLSAKVFDTTVGIVPLAPEMRAQMTLARIDALPNSVTSETILPPTEMHPDLVQRGMEVRRRLPLLGLMTFAGVAVVAIAPVLGAPSTPLSRMVTILLGMIILFFAVAYGTLLPAEIRLRLPSEGRRRKL